ncbi:MAG: exodeoxyribonuclease VII small subunit [Clostridia bacterium]|nr:exodeoxyribonuclease VII small subunit [Clostridia bacterium]
MEKEMSFEKAYKMLEEIADKLESNEITLDESISLFEEGVKLSKYCSDVLDKAKQKIEILEKGIDEK